MNERLKLSELNGRVKKAVTEAFTGPVWVIGEISELKTNRSGHCYLVLIEKDELGDDIVAQARATIWSYTYRMLLPYFESMTGRPLAEGIKVLVSVSVEFHELYGYSLNIRDIDPTYTLGDMARRRREIIARLQSEGVADMNKELELPLVPQNVAIISSSTAAGYQDFISQLANNAAGYQFNLKLFPAIMQGTQAESSIIGALELIYLYEHFFDVVVIIRGGGSQADLSCFDNYNLAFYITQFPLPVITGIGHEKDDTIVDMVAHTRLKTPTAVAEFLIYGVSQFDLRLDDLRARVMGRVGEFLISSKSNIEKIGKAISPVAREKISKGNFLLNQTVWKINSYVRNTIRHQTHHLERKEEVTKTEFKYFIKQQSAMLQKTAMIFSGTIRHLTAGSHELLNRKMHRSENLIRTLLADKEHQLELSRQKAILFDPYKILARGYSVTYLNGRALKDAELVNENAIIETRLYKGKLISEVKIRR